MERYDIRVYEWETVKAEDGDFVLYTDAQATVEALQRERDGLEAKCLEEHVTIEQADAKVMKLEGDKGMWANERRDLLTQLENAESQLSQLRALVREIKKEFDNCTHECERCGESDPLTTFDIYRTVAKAATLDAMTPAECTNHFTDGSKIFPSRNCCSKGGDGE